MVQSWIKVEPQAWFWPIGESLLQSEEIGRSLARFPLPVWCRPPVVVLEEHIRLPPRWYVYVVLPLVVGG